MGKLRDGARERWSREAGFITVLLSLSNCGKKECLTLRDTSTNGGDDSRAWRELKREYVGYALSLFLTFFLTFSMSPALPFPLFLSVTKSHPPTAPFRPSLVPTPCAAVGWLMSSLKAVKNSLPSFYLKRKKKNFSRTQQACLSIAHLSWCLTGCGKPGEFIPWHWDYFVL